MSTGVISAPAATLKFPVHGLSVCIPVYNEEAAVGVTLERCLALRPQLAAAGVQHLEVIAVDDGSRDGSVRKIREYPGVRLIEHGVNRGYGAALKTGFAAAQYDLVGFLDADATYPPEHLPALCRAALDGADLVVGSRMSGNDSAMPAIRRLGNWFFAGFLSFVARTPISDSASGMRVFKKDVLDTLSPLPDGLNLTPVMTTRAAHEKIRLVEVSIPYRERMGPSHLSVVRDGVRFLQTIAWTTLTYNPVRLLGTAGLASISVALLVALALGAMRLGGVTTLGPLGVFAVFAALVCGVTGVSVFALGASFNYLVSLFHRQPIRQGLFSKPLLKTPIERWYLPLGSASLLGGIALGAFSLTMSLRGWAIERLWLYFSASALLILTGVQLGLWWLVMNVLSELNARERSREHAS